MIKAVAFDFGNVLCRLDRPSCDAALASHSPLPAAEVTARIWGGELERDFETGRCDSREYFARVKDAIAAHRSWTYEEFSGEFMKCLVPHPAGERAVLRARELGLRVFILSNTSFLHARFIFGREILATVPEIYALSFRIGVMKPDPAIWSWLLDKAGVKAEECAYFDDIPAYRDTAASLGFRAFLHDPVKGDLTGELESVASS